MRTTAIVRVLMLTLTVLFGAATAKAEPRVELELATEPGFPLTGAHAWIEMLSDLGIENVRIRQAKVGDQTQIKTEGSGDFTVHRVTGALTAANQLQLPAGRFSLHDKARLAQWLAKIKAGGVEELTAPRTMFGLTPQELGDVSKRLARPLTFSTKDQAASESAKSLVRGLGFPATLDRPALAAFESDWRFPDELLGISQGTALAVLLRPLGLAFVPQRELGGRVSLRIAPQGDLRESWPLGWPPDKKPQESAPDLFKFLNVEIADTPLSDALGAIQGRLDLPFLYDYNTMTRDRIDPAATKVSLPGGRTYYKRILDRLLFQAKLKSDVRVDESGAPFLWITSVKP